MLILYHLGNEDMVTAPVVVNTLHPPHQGGRQLKRHNYGNGIVNNTNIESIKYTAIIKIRQFRGTNILEKNLTYDFVSFRTLTNLYIFIKLRLLNPLFFNI